MRVKHPLPPTAKYQNTGQGNAHTVAPPVFVGVKVICRPEQALRSRTQKAQTVPATVPPSMLRARIAGIRRDGRSLVPVYEKAARSKKVPSVFECERFDCWWEIWSDSNPSTPRRLFEEGTRSSAR